MCPGRKAVRRPGRRPACPKQGRTKILGRPHCEHWSASRSSSRCFLVSLPASRFLLSRARYTRSLLSQIHSSLFFCSLRLQNTTALHPTLWRNPVVRWRDVKWRQRKSSTLWLMSLSTIMPTIAGLLLMARWENIIALSELFLPPYSFAVLVCFLLPRRGCDRGVLFCLWSIHFFLLLLSCCFCCYLLVPYLSSVGRNVSVKWAFACQASRILYNPLDQAASSGYSWSFCFLCVFTAYSRGWFIGGALLMIRGKRAIVPLAFVSDL